MSLKNYLKPGQIFIEDGKSLKKDKCCINHTILLQYSKPSNDSRYRLTG